MRLTIISSFYKNEERNCENNTRQWYDAREYVPRNLLRGEIEFDRLIECRLRNMNISNDQRIHRGNGNREKFHYPVIRNPCLTWRYYVETVNHRTKILLACYIFINKLPGSCKRAPCMQDDQFYFACTCTAVTEVFSAELHLSWQIYDARENYIEILHNLCNVLSNSRFRDHQKFIINLHRQQQHVEKKMKKTDTSRTIFNLRTT